MLCMIFCCAFGAAVLGCDYSAADHRVSTGTWTQVDMSTNAPSGWYASAMAYAEASDTVILLEGSKIDEEPHRYLETWSLELETATWSKISPIGESPTSRAWNSMVYDSTADRVLMFGGVDNEEGIRDDTWAYDPAARTWTRLDPSGDVQSAHMGHAMVYDKQAERTIVFGGQDADNYLWDETWAYDSAANTWTNLAPASAPSARRGHCMTYDDQTGDVLLFGGEDATSRFLNDLWAYDFSENTWTCLEPKGDLPLARTLAAMAFDSTRGVAVLFGGIGIQGDFPASLSDTHASLSDTWIYSVKENQWTQLNTPTGSPEARSYCGMVYDPERDSVIVCGGLDQPGGMQVFSDVWILKLKP